jgi:glucokinase
MKPARRYDKVVLAGDVGGVSTVLALAGIADGRVEILDRAVTASKNVDDFPALVARTRAAYEQHTGLSIDLCCVGANGPVVDNFCFIHNLAWQIDGAAVQKASGLRTVIVNDFTAVSYGLPFVDTSDPRQAVTLHAGAGPQGGVRAVIGTETGMGVGVLVEQGSRHVVLASEGGHMDFAAFDPMTQRFRAFVEKRTGSLPSVEQCCSGIGLRNLFFFAVERGWFARNPGLIAEAEASGFEDLPRLIRENAARDPGCRKVLQGFIRIYARFAANVAVTVLPRAGLYLAGNLGSDNLSSFLGNNLFRSTFIQHGNAVMRRFLEEMPLIMLMNEDAALIGAANAGSNLLG